MLELVQDAYSPNRSVRTETERMKLPVILEDRTEYLTVEQPVLGQHGRAVDMVFLPEYPRVRQTADSVDLEFPGMFQGLVYDENDVLQGISSRWEGKLSLPAHENSRVQTAVTAGDVQPMSSAEGMILTAPLSAAMRTVTDQEIPVVTGLEFGELQEPDPSRPSLIVRCCGDASLWELAKNCGSSVAAISAANGLTAEPSADKLLLIPVL